MIFGWKIFEQSCVFGSKSEFENESTTGFTLGCRSWFRRCCLHEMLPWIAFVRNVSHAWLGLVQKCCAKLPAESLFDCRKLSLVMVCCRECFRWLHEVCMERCFEKRTLTPWFVFNASMAHKIEKINQLDPFLHDSLPWYIFMWIVDRFQWNFLR